MTYAKLQQLDNNMGQEEMHDSLVSLVNDPRFAAVVKLLESHREQFVSATSQQALAAHHGALAHAGGSIYALDTFAGVVKQLCEPPKRRGMQAPPAAKAK